MTRPAPGERPITRPSIPDLGASTRPGIARPSPPTRPGAARPAPGDVGDFLGLDKPLRPETLPGATRPGIARPDRPGGADRPGSSRPGRPAINDRPINIGDINIGHNNIVNTRPGWVNIDRGQINQIGNRWQNQIGGIHNWAQRYPNRLAYWHGWGNGVRGRWGYWHGHHGWFNAGWWHNHLHPWCGWHYGYWFNRRPWGYWWTYPTYAAISNWFAWSAPANVWSQPVYYDYGQGGNVIYEDNSVYINGAQIAPADAFAESAMDLATVAPPQDDAAAEAAEWLALGTFAVSSSEQEVDPTRVLQLAVDKQGVISGTLFNTETDEAKSVQGQVDKNTQRVAFRVGESEDVVIETGIYNLTQEEAPILVHFGQDKVENWLLVRMENPEADAGDGDAAAK